MLEEAPKISIVVPARNEAANLRVVLPELPDVHEVILVDGRSVDGTVEAARTVRPDVKILQQTRRGKGNALVCGFAAATGDIIVMFDADGSADPREIPMFVDALTNGAHYAKGSRFCRTGTGRSGSDDISPLRWAGNAGLNTVANILFRTRFSDLCYGFNAFWRSILPLLRLPPVIAPAVEPGRLLWGDGFEIEAILSCRVAIADLRVTEVPSLERRRIFGDTNLRTFSDGSRVLRTLVAERLRAGYRHSPTRGATPVVGRPVLSGHYAERAAGSNLTTPSRTAQVLGAAATAVPGHGEGTLRQHPQHSVELPSRSSGGGVPRVFSIDPDRSCAHGGDGCGDS